MRSEPYQDYYAAVKDAKKQGLGSGAVYRENGAWVFILPERDETEWEG